MIFIELVHIFIWYCLHASANSTYETYGIVNNNVGTAKMKQYHYINYGTVMRNISLNYDTTEDGLFAFQNYSNAKNKCGFTYKKYAGEYEEYNLDETSDSNNPKYNYYRIFLFIIFYTYLSCVILCIYYFISFCTVLY